ncbi:MAG: hypothetical protein HN521_08885 [Candidatus Latescibacteria bacterium]|mgnify:CR=1|jgi:hypothetical protein|nr:hypothetical protein [Candidatus Latescibacterota bacterium]MBT5831190.1 hypothetical protein [Candidatus Latescibacterota bacterium]
MKQTQHIQLVVLSKKTSIKQKLVTLFRRQKQNQLRAKLHRYRATASAQAA